MAYKEILVALTTYPDPTPVGAVERAVGLARTMGARASAIACEVVIKVPGRFDFLANALLDVPALRATEMKRSADNARNLLAAFERAARERSVFSESIVERCEPIEVPDVVVDHARLRDLTMVPVPEGEFIDQWLAEEIIFGSGRPTMVFPQSSAESAPAKLDNVVVAWDFSRPAARAIWDALPILAQAKSVRAVTFAREKSIRTGRSGADLGRYLKLHDVDAAVETEQTEGEPIGEALKRYIAAHDADLLIMGAYGHSRVREFILGGATRSMLQQPPLPILLSH